MAIAQKRKVDDSSIFCSNLYYFNTTCNFDSLQILDITYIVKCWYRLLPTDFRMNIMGDILCLPSHHSQLLLKTVAPHNKTVLKYFSSAYFLLFMISLQNVMSDLPFLTFIDVKYQCETSLYVKFVLIMMSLFW